MSTEEIKAIVRRWIDEVWKKGDLDAVDEIFAADFVFHYAGTQGEPDREGYEEAVTGLVAPFADVHAAVEDVITEGDKVVLRWTWGGTHTGEFWGIPPTGVQATVTGISILRIEGGKIVEEWGEMDNMGLMAQLGVE